MSKSGDRYYVTCVEKSTFFCISVALALPDRAVAVLPPTPIRSYKEDSTLSRRTFGMPKADELKDMARLLANLWEAAQRLPEGSERQDAFRQINNFHLRVAVLVTRAL
jgi:hypothetical protein